MIFWGCFPHYLDVHPSVHILRTLGPADATAYLSMCTQPITLQCNTGTWLSPPLDPLPQHYRSGHNIIEINNYPTGHFNKIN